MYAELTPCKNKKVCVALSGGRDSMALLHYISTHAQEFGITLSALNCDHAMRGEESGRDSAFVRAYCAANNIPLTFFKAEEGQLNTEEEARVWRRECYKKAIEDGAELIATAHHLNDNAETVLFNLARGSALAGMTGITDGGYLVRPLIACSRAEIDLYIEENNIPFVTDSTNFSEDYTRNRIRHKILPELESAVPGAAGAIFRFSRLAAEDEEYFSRMVAEILIRRGEGYLIKSCTEPVIFKRALRRILFEKGLKDFTAAQLRTVYEMQWLSNGKRFEFLGLVAIREDGGIAVTPSENIKGSGECISFIEFLNGREDFCGREITVREGKHEPQEGFRALFIDLDEIPQEAVVRFKRTGDTFKKFGGGKKSLSDFLTDKKVPQSLRATLPLICIGGEVLAVCGVEISDGLKLKESTKRTATLICRDPFYMGI